MISSKTLNIDNPKLNCRLKGYEKFSPRRIILDRNLAISLKSYIFRSTKKDNTILIYNKSDKKKIKILKKKGIILIKSKLDNKGLFDFKIVFKKLFLKGIRNLLVEGGDKITKYLIKKGLVDRFYLFKSDKKIISDKINQSFTSLDILNNKYKNKLKLSPKLAKDKITIYKR